MGSTRADNRPSAIILRFAGLYGPGRAVRRSLLERGEPIPGEPEKFLNLIHIDDAARAALAALESRHAEAVYVVSDDRPVTRLEYYARMAELLGSPPPKFRPPAPEAPSRRVKRPASASATPDQKLAGPHAKLSGYRHGARNVSERIGPDLTHARKSATGRGTDRLPQPVGAGST